MREKKSYLYIKFSIASQIKSRSIPAIYFGLLHDSKPKYVRQLSLLIRMMNGNVIKLAVGYMAMSKTPGIQRNTKASSFTLSNLREETYLKSKMIIEAAGEAIAQFFCPSTSWWPFRTGKGLPSR